MVDFKVLSSTQALEASLLVGRQILIANNRIQVDAQDISPMYIVINEAIEQLKIEIKDTHQTLISEQIIANIPKGLFTFQWDGQTLEDTQTVPGFYYLDAYKYPQQDKLLTLVIENINSVSLDKGELRLTLTQNDAISMEQIIAIK